MATYCRHQGRPELKPWLPSVWCLGAPSEQLKVGVHAFGYCAETDQQAADEFFPGYADGTNAIGVERGWPTMTRARFQALLGDEGALVVGSPQTVARKILRFDRVLGGISRFDFQMSPAAVEHPKLLAATRLIGGSVIPLIRQAGAASNMQQDHASEAPSAER